MVPADLSNFMRRIDVGAYADHMAALCDLVGPRTADLRLLQPPSQRVLQDKDWVIRMKSRHSSKLLDDLRARQRNTLWPDTLRNARTVDAFLWKGSPDATPIQRAGSAIF